MSLKCRVPKVLRVLMVRGEEAGMGRKRVGRESEREGELDRTAIRPPALALEFVERKIADAARAKFVGVCRAAPFQHQHRHPLAARKEIVVEGAEGKLA